MARIGITGNPGVGKHTVTNLLSKKIKNNKIIHENLLSEILGICFYDSLKVFGKKKISEIDTTYDDPEESVKKIIHHYDYKLKRQIGLVDWLDLIYRTGDAKKF